jgi:hypothetical protein
MNMQVGKVETAPAPTGHPSAESQRARSVGIFGFHLTFSSGLAWTVLIVEAAGVVMLLLTAALLWRRR